MKVSTDYIQSIMKYGLVGGSAGLSTRGSILRTNASIEIDKARSQLAGLKKDNSRSLREKSELAAIGSQKLTSALDKEMSLTLNDIKIRRDKEQAAINKALASDWDQSASAIFAIELSKDSKKTLASLTDKNALMALSNAPEAITKMKPETLAAARNTYIRKNHPEIEAEQNITDADLRLVENLAALNDGFNKEYESYTSHQDLNTGSDSEY